MTFEELQRQVYALAESGRSINAALLNERKGAILQNPNETDLEAAFATLSGA